MLSAFSTENPELSLRSKTPLAPRAKNFLHRQFQIIFLSIFIVGVATFAILSKTENMYTATTLVAIDTGADQLIASSGNTSVFQLASSLVDSEVEILRSYDTMRQVISDLPTSAHASTNQSTTFGGLASLIASATARSTDAPYNETRMVIDLVERTTIERLGHSFVVGVNVSDASPERAAQLANALAESYLYVRRETRLATVHAAEAVLATRVSDLDANLRSIEGRIDDMLLAAAAANLSRQEGVTTAHTNAVADVLANLASQRRALFAERAELTLLLQSEPKMVDTGDSPPRVRRSQIDEQLNALETITADARLQLQRFLNTEDLGPSLTLSVQRLQGEAQTTRQVYQEALERWRDVQLLTSHQTHQARILSHAIPPLESDQPTKLYVGVAGLVLGLGVGVGLGLVREQMFIGVFDADTIERATPLQIISLLPTVSRFDANAPQELVITQPGSRFAEGVRRIARTLDSTIDLEQRRERALCVLMTSFNANEGKSTLALAYAMHEAKSGRSTLLVDADLRQSALYTRLNWQMDGAEVQFSDVLAGQSTLADIGSLTFRDPETGMDVLGNTRPPYGSTETLLTSERFADLINAAKCKYDVVVIDSAPVAQAADARLLLSYADIVVMAIRYGRTRLPNIQKTLQRLGQHPAPPILGALTFVKPASADT